jgi:predicted MPP superfamily phosphohydrolase
MSSRLKRILPFLIVFTSVLGSIHYFVFQVTADEMAPSVRAATIAILACGLLSIPLGLLLSHGPWRKTLKPLTVFSYFWLGYFFILFSFCILSLAVMIFSDALPSYWPWEAAFLAAAWSVFRALSPPQIVTYQLPGPASIQGLSLVQLSDLHIGMPFLNEAWLQRQVKRINALNPDFVAITGDLADGPFHEVAPQLAPLEKIEAKKFYVTGNHEFIRGGEWEQRLRELGFTVLHNENEIFYRAGGSFLIGGVPDRAILSFGERFESNPAKALSSPLNTDYRILLAHEPKSVFHLNGAPCDLLLSGHVHGGQIFPFGFFVRLAQPLARGFKRIHGTLVFAHMGTGFWGPPMRWLTRSEIVHFKWTVQVHVP